MASEPVVYVPPPRVIVFFKASGAMADEVPFSAVIAASYRCEELDMKHPSDAPHFYRCYYALMPKEDGLRPSNLRRITDRGW